MVPTALIRDHKSVLHYITDIQMKHAKCQLTSQAVDLKSYSLQFSLDESLLEKNCMHNNITNDLTNVRVTHSRKIVRFDLNLGTFTAQIRYIV